MDRNTYLMSMLNPREPSIKERVYDVLKKSNVFLWLAVRKYLEDVPKAPSDEDVREAVVAFQRMRGLVPDGIAGPLTLWDLQYLHLDASKRLAFETVPADIVPGIEGFSQLRLREDAAAAYRKLKEEVNRAGGVITTAGGIRALSEGASASRSATSHHYWGGAFDLALTSLFFRPRTDPFVVEQHRNGDRITWTMWARAEDALPRTLKVCYWDNWNSGVDKFMEVHDTFINFTELAEQHGFKPIPARAGFTRATNRQYTSAEHWHFQYEAALVEQASQFGIELLKCYPESELRTRANIWDRRRAVFRRDWL